MAKTLNVAVIGVGFMGKVHSGGYNDANEFFGNPSAARYKLLIACGVEGEDVAGFAQRFGFAETSMDWRKVVNDPRVDIVDICAPNHMHEEIAAAAAKAGKRVFVEKPLGVDLAAAQRINAAVSSGGQRSLVGLCYRGFSAVQEARARIAGGAHLAFNAGSHCFVVTDYGKGISGRIYEGATVFDQDWGIDPSATNFRFFAHMAGEAGVIGDLGEHEFDGQIFVLGMYPTHVSAITQVVIAERPDPTWVRPAGDEKAKAPMISTGGAIDAYRATLLYPGGVVMTAGATRFRRGCKARFNLEAYAHDASVRWELEAGNHLRLYVHKLRLPGSDEAVSIPSTARGWTDAQCTNGEHAAIGAYTVPGLENAYRDALAGLLAHYAHAEGGLIPWDICHFANVEHAARLACITEAVLQSGKRHGETVEIKYCTMPA